LKIQLAVGRWQLAIGTNFVCEQFYCSFKNYPAMKQITILFFLLAFGYSASAQKYMTKNGFIGFYSHTSMEEIKADNNQVASVLDTGTGDMVFQVLIKSFHFDRALMEEHFNENYMESDKYPKSTFKGKFVDFDFNNFSKDGKYNATIQGDLSIHGVTKQIKQTGTVEVKDGKIIAKSKFNVKPGDFNIAIPSLVKDKIASNMDVTVDITYEPMKQTK
jgi:hypothetical protein